jgi:hypothetical protein
VIVPEIEVGVAAACAIVVNGIFGLVAALMGPASPNGMRTNAKNAAARKGVRTELPFQEGW